MPNVESPGKPTTRRYSPEEKAAAVRMVRALRAELGSEHGTVHRVAGQLGYGVESVRFRVCQADIDEGQVPGVSTSDSARMKALEQENRELKRANEMAVDSAISLARRNSAFSCFSLLISAISSVVLPGLVPPSTSARRTHLRSDSGEVIPASLRSNESPRTRWDSRPEIPGPSVPRAHAAR
ncbi:MAG: transposase, partial [Nocardioidaceae bacterium]|nr:transposase [Nocardioidaceae bacterium]